jgi:hypothetical protein
MILAPYLREKREEIYIYNPTNQNLPFLSESLYLDLDKFGVLLPLVFLYYYSNIFCSFGEWSLRMRFMLLHLHQFQFSAVIRGGEIS